jgi:hypothetical protein
MLSSDTLYAYAERKDIINSELAVMALQVRLTAN